MVGVVVRALEPHHEQADTHHHIKEAAHDAVILLHRHKAALIPHMLEAHRKETEAERALLTLAIHAVQAGVQAVEVITVEAQTSLTVQAGADLQAIHHAEVLLLEATEDEADEKCQRLTHLNSSIRTP